MRQFGRLIRNRPDTPEIIGKAERFMQTLPRERPSAIPYRSSDSGTRDVPRWITLYNERLLHCALAILPPAPARNNLMRTLFQRHIRLGRRLMRAMTECG